MTTLLLPNSPSIGDEVEYPVGSGKKRRWGGKGWRRINAFQSLIARVEALEAAAGDEDAGSGFMRQYDSGNFGELVASVPIPVSLGAEIILYRIGPMELEAGDLLIGLGNVEFTNPNDYEAVVACQILLTTSPTDTTGYEMSEKAGTNVRSSTSHHMNLPTLGTITVPATDTYWAVIIGNSASSSSSGSPIMTVESDSGRLNILHLRPSARGDYFANAVEFTGSNWMTRGTSLDAIVDGKVGLFSAWLKLDAAKDGASNYICATETNTPRFAILRNASNKLQVIGRNTAGTTILQLDSLSSWTSASGYFHMAANWDLAAGIGKLLINGVDDLNTGTDVTTNANIDYTRGDFAIGALLDGTGGFDGAMADFYLHLNPFRNYGFDTPANLQWFRPVTGKPGFIGDYGKSQASPDTAVTDAEPAIWLSGPTYNWHKNRGKSGAFTMSGGALTTAATSPSD